MKKVNKAPIKKNLKDNVYGKTVIRYKLISQEYSEAISQILFTIQDKETKYTITKTADLIVLDKKILFNLSAEDMFCVSYTAGLEHAAFRFPPI